MQLTSEVRKRAERSARIYLEMRGYDVLELNWGSGRNKIDTIASRKSIIYFISIQYSSDDSYRPIDPPTKASIEKLERAADAWITENKYGGKYQFASIEIAGPDFSVIGFYENLV